MHTMQLNYMSRLISLAVLLLMEQQTEAVLPRAAGYCNGISTKEVLVQSGDFVDIYWVDYPSYSSGGSITEDCIMSIGATGGGVQSLQSTLNNCHGESLAEDGDYGPLTKAAVKRVRSTLHLS
jgi:hypothetical protein